MEIPEKAKEILKHEGVVAIATQGKDGPHLVNTWHSYIQLTATGNLLVPAGGMKRTEENLLKDNRIVATIGSREVTGMRGPGAGFLIKGTAKLRSARKESRGRSVRGAAVVKGHRHALVLDHNP
jgi:hypothetical protein